MKKLRKGQLAFLCGTILLAGHALVFFFVWSNVNISPTSKNDMIAIILPLTVASAISAVLYAVKHGEIDLSKTAEVNGFFMLVVIGVPVVFFVILIWGIVSLDGDSGVDDFKIFIVSFEAAFGGIFTIATEALFGSPKKSDETGTWSGN